MSPIYRTAICPGRYMAFFFNSKLVLILLSDTAPLP